MRIPRSFHGMEQLQPNSPIHGNHPLTHQLTLKDKGKTIIPPVTVTAPKHTQGSRFDILRDMDQGDTTPYSMADDGPKEYPEIDESIRFEGKRTPTILVAHQ